MDTITPQTVKHPLLNITGTERRFCGWGGTQGRALSEPKAPATANGWPMKWSDSKNWMTYAEVRAAMQRGTVKGIGYFVTNGDHPEMVPITVVDLDHCVENGVIVGDWQRAVVELANTLTVISPSGTGLHLIFLGAEGFVAPEIPAVKGHETRGFECFSKAHHVRLSFTIFHNVPFQAMTRELWDGIAALLPGWLEEVAALEQTASEAKTKADKPQSVITPPNEQTALRTGQLTKKQRSRAAAIFNDHRDLADILKARHYDVASTSHKTDRGMQTDVVRPGKDPKDGTSGNILNGTIYYPFSNDDGLEARKPYTAFTAWCAFEHGGDETAAAWAASTLLGFEHWQPTEAEKMETLEPGDEQVAELFPDEAVTPASLVKGTLPKVTRTSKDRRTCDDIGNGYRFADQHRNRARYVNQWGWMINDGKRYVRDTTGAAMRLAKQTAESIWLEVLEAGKVDSEAGQKRAKQLASWAAASRSRGRLEAILAMAQSELPAEVEDFDKDPLLLNVQNGTLDMRTGELRPHNPADMLSRICNASYNPTAQAPLWNETLLRFLPAKLLRAFVRRSLGLAATGLTKKAFWFLFGALGDNGKSTITGTVAYVLGDYARRISVDVLMSKHRSPGEDDQLASLAGARFVVSNEVDDRQMNTKMIKDLTGEMDVIRTKHMGMNTFEFRPRFKLFIYGNKQPKLDATDQALWNRVNCVPFSVTIPKSEQIANFMETLQAESDGILTSLVEGFMDYQRVGLDVPEEISAATTAYRAEMDTLGQFIAECCITHPSAFAKTADLHAAYEAFTGEKVKPGDLTKELKARGLVRDRATGGARGWAGIGIISTESASSSDSSDTSASKNGVSSRDEKAIRSDTTFSVTSVTSVTNSVLKAARELFEQRGSVKIADITDFLDELAVKTGASEGECAAVYQELFERGELRVV